MNRPSCGYQPKRNSLGEIIATICSVMEVAESDMPGKSTPCTKPRLVWARNMAAHVMHAQGYSDRQVADLFETHRISILVRRRRMAEDLENLSRYRAPLAEILKRLGQPTQAPQRKGEAA